MGLVIFCVALAGWVTDLFKEITKHKNNGCDCNQVDKDKKKLDRKSFLTKITVWAGSFIGVVLTFPLVTAMLDQ